MVTNEFERDRADDRRLQRALLVKWGLGFAALFLLVLGALWWSGAAVRYGASRVKGAGAPTYEVSGMVVDSATRRGVPWALITTDIDFGTQFFETSADATGSYRLMTLAEPHRLLVRASGYRDASVTIGRQWFSWLPKGAEKKDIELAPR